MRFTRDLPSVIFGLTLGLYFCVFSGAAKATSLGHARAFSLVQHFHEIAESNLADARKIHLLDDDLNLAHELVAANYSELGSSQVIRLERKITELRKTLRQFERCARASPHAALKQKQTFYQQKLVALSQINQILETSSP